MRQLINRHQYELSINKDFDGVIRGCATAQNRDIEDGAWLGPDIVKAYTKLHHQGFAASVEVWEKQGDGHRLVGGLYGVNLGKAFMGESMFSLVPNASKLALIHLARLFGSLGGLMIDCQFETPHLRSMGGRYIPYDEYIALIRQE
jgi:leucyl/phenylalanyl-tRNA--protein transferase